MNLNKNEKANEYFNKTIQMTNKKEKISDYDLKLVFDSIFNIGVCFKKLNNNFNSYKWFLKSRAFLDNLEKFNVKGCDILEERKEIEKALNFLRNEITMDKYK